MPLLPFDSLASQLPGTWRSQVLGQVGPARIKVLRMDPQAYIEETHDYNEGLLVTSGCLQLTVAGEPVTVEAGQMYLVEAGVPHAVLAGSHGTLVIIDL
ncbi:cupin domain-containing protein [Pseudomonas sp. TH05]|uniref:cupin domain-containing protein n=1 Tax=unclassified Pseudomonas TaxID=196821 RepID=UPI0009963100|nr:MULTISPECIES: cupin domain-containing protein [unclassified Pseudomonas]MBK5536811.1 cupin domain-containing protein [Pseudomonas sp. TH07]MBK5558916.1 cupin domain-containing protein [Pseudomonas sp. TH05]OOV93493.1 cupin [Pseudomonas sp. MF4836]